MISSIPSTQKKEPVLFSELYENAGFSWKGTKTKNLCGILLWYSKIRNVWENFGAILHLTILVSLSPMCALCVDVYTHILWTYQINLPVILSLRHLLPYPHSEVTLPFPQIRNKKGSKGWGGCAYRSHICVKLAMSSAPGVYEYGLLGCDSRMKTWCSDTIQFLSVAQRVPLSWND